MARPSHFEVPCGWRAALHMAGLDVGVELGGGAAGKPIKTRRSRDASMRIVMVPSMLGLLTADRGSEVSSILNSARWV